MEAVLGGWGLTHYAWVATILEEEEGAGIQILSCYKQLESDNQGCQVRDFLWLQNVQLVTGKVYLKPFK